MTQEEIAAAVREAREVREDLARQERDRECEEERLQTAKNIGTLHAIVGMCRERNLPEYVEVLEWAIDELETLKGD